MIWMTWRQHRAAALGGLLLLAACAALMIPQGLAMHQAFDSQGLAHCVGVATAPPDCSNTWRDFPSGATNLITPWLVIVPVLVGVLLGAPLIAREIETGTYRLVWAQSTTRTRWIAVKLGALALGVATVSALFAWLVTWWRQPVDQLDTNNSMGRFGSFAFSVEGTVVVGYALFAFFLGVLAGTVLRRTVLAMVVATVAFVVVLFGVEFLARPYYLPPVTSLTAFPVGQSLTTTFTPDRTGTPGDWLLDWGFVDSTGHRLDTAQINDASRSALDARTSMPTWLHDHGIQHLLVYQPADRFWTFQLIETGIFLALSVVLAGVVVWHVQRRLP